MQMKVWLPKVIPLRAGPIYLTFYRGEMLHQLRQDGDCSIPKASSLSRKSESNEQPAQEVCWLPPTTFNEMRLLKGSS